ncbi:MAG: serine protease [Pseudomonadota bacterium]
MTRVYPVALACLLTLLLHVHPASAQRSDDIVWVQIEAQPNLAQATARASVYASELEDVNGFALGRGWYGIAVGPYKRADAQQVLRSYVQQRLIPRDSFIQTSNRFRQQFWPVGANVLNRGVIALPEAAQTSPQSQTPEAAAETVPPPPVPAEETVSEARASEAALTGEERRDLQIALKWGGFYAAAIDGAFGRGTRRSMGAWQEANNFEVTGILTTKQRAVLLGQYNAVLDGLDMALVRDARAGIEMAMPTAEVSFERYEAPFAQYNATGGLGARVLLISQAGNQDTLFGLYDIMQTLEIVPLNGPRTRNSSSFELVGENSRVVSETRVSLDAGQIKGFTLIWPAGDEERRTRVLQEMEKSFTRLPGALDPAAGSDAQQAIDLAAGLQIRQPKRARSGFFATRDGLVVTTSEVVEGCGRITLDGDVEAEVLRADGGNGVVLLQPRSPLAPRAVAALRETPPRLQSEISVAGYPYGGVLSAATVTFGTLADIQGLRGEDTIKRLALLAQEGDAGGPVFDAAGNVVGMLLPRAAEGPQLPEDTRFAVQGSVLASTLRDAGLTPAAQFSTAPIAPQDLRRTAQDMTVLVSCWD